MLWTKHLYRRVQQVDDGGTLDDLATSLNNEYELIMELALVWQQAAVMLILVRNSLSQSV